MLLLDSVQNFDPLEDAAFFAALPSRPGVFLIEMRAENAEPYLARTADLRRAAERLLRPPEVGSKRLNLREVAARVQYRVTPSKFEQILTLYGQARARFPQRYRAVMRLRPPAMLKVNLRNEYPRCYVTRSIRADEGFYLGPFHSRRAAEDFAEGFLDLFKIRRCQIKIRRDPAYPGCIYSEMKMCLAPCFAGCTKEEYDVEAGRVLATLHSCGSWLKETLEDEREAASEALDFERAAGIHKRIEKVAAALRLLPELARPVTELNAIILQRTAEEKAIIAFPIRAGILGEPLFLRFAEISSEPRSVEMMLREQLAPETIVHLSKEKKRSAFPSADVAAAPDAPSATEEAMPAPPATHSEASIETLADFREKYGLRSAPSELPEHLALLARWFYSKPREGEIFFREADWPYRRILRACARLLGAPAAPPKKKPEPSSSETKPAQS
jgi:excinuclease ABC subunit C